MKSSNKDINLELVAKSEDTVKEISGLKRCPICQGRGKVKPLFFVIDCDDCHGTGLDVSDPIAVIQQQQEYLKKAREVIIHQRSSLYCLIVSEQERTAESMEKYYSSTKSMD
jgi:RecJ-like exonuclease